MAVDWTITDEIRLYRWVAEFKPAGINKHFHMLCIVERMNHPDKYPVILLQKESVRPGKVFTAGEIWDKLSTVYNLEEVDKLEDIEVETVPNSGSTDGKPSLFERKQRLSRVRDFELPWDEYGELILENARNGVDDEDEASDREDLDKRRSTRVRKSLRLKRAGGEEDMSSNETSDNEAHEVSDGKSKEGSQEPGAGAEDVLEETEATGDQPLAKRTRHSSQTRATSDTSPKRKRRATDQASSVPTRVSSRLRNRKQ